MTLVNGVWYDNEIGNTKIWRKQGYKHEFGMENNIYEIPIVKCIKCHWSRMWISTFENKGCP